MIDPETRKEIRRLYKEGFSKTLIKEKTGVSRPTIRDIVSDIPDKDRVSAKRVGKPSTAAGEPVVSEEGEEIKLTARQVQRLQGISHLEGGRKISEIINRMIDFDVSFRRLDLKQDDLQHLRRFLKEARGQGLKLDTLVKLSERGVSYMSADLVAGLVELLQILRLHGWSPTTFVSEAANVKGWLGMFIRYKRGDLSAREYKMRLRAQ